MSRNPLSALVSVGALCEVYFIPEGETEFVTDAHVTEQVADILREHSDVKLGLQKMLHLDPSGIEQLKEGLALVMVDAAVQGLDFDKVRLCFSNALEHIPVGFSVLTDGEYGTELSFTVLGTGNQVTLDLHGPTKVDIKTWTEQLYTYLASVGPNSSAVEPEEAVVADAPETVQPEPVEQDQSDCAFAIIKGPSVARGHAPMILDYLRENSFEILRVEAVTISEDMNRKLYLEHVDHPYFYVTEAVMTKPQVCIAVWVKGLPALAAMRPEEADSITALRNLAGRVSDGRQCEAHTIRRIFHGAVFGSHPDFYADNALHVSDSVSDIEREVAVLFAPDTSGDAREPVVISPRETWPLLCDIELGFIDTDTWAHAMDWLKIQRELRKVFSEDQVLMNLLTNPLEQKTKVLSVVRTILADQWRMRKHLLKSLGITFVKAVEGVVYRFTVTYANDPNWEDDETISVSVDLHTSASTWSEYIPKVTVSSNETFCGLIGLSFTQNYTHKGAFWSGGARTLRMATIND